jgi:uncharacterized membrane protein
MAGRSARDYWRGTGGGDVVEPAAAWRVWTALALSLIGLGVSLYLTVAHFVGSQALVCSANGVVNCEKVTTSAQSYFLHIPVAVLGLAYYVVVSVIDLPMMWRIDDRRVHIARLVLAFLGMGFALYLISAELLIIGNICLWCTGVHVVTFLLFVLVLTTVPRMLGWGTVPAQPAPRPTRAPTARPRGSRPRSATASSQASRRH